MFYLFIFFVYLFLIFIGIIKQILKKSEKKTIGSDFRLVLHLSHVVFLKMAIFQVEFYYIRSRKLF